MEANLMNEGAAFGAVISTLRAMAKQVVCHRHHKPITPVTKPAIE
jgi:hypothetical protein